jgi:hypothetical protein
MAYGTPRFITELTKALHRTLPWANKIQSPSTPISHRSRLRLSSHLRLGLPSGLFPSGFPNSGPNQPDGLLNLKVHHRINQSPPPDPVLGQQNPVSFNSYLLILKHHFTTTRYAGYFFEEQIKSGFGSKPRTYAFRTFDVLCVTEHVVGVALSG